MTIQPIPDPNTPIGQIIKAAGSEGIVLESEGQERYASLPLDQVQAREADSSFSDPPCRGRPSKSLLGP